MIKVHIRIGNWLIAEIDDGYRYFTAAHLGCSPNKKSTTTRAGLSNMFIIAGLAGLSNMFNTKWGWAYQIDWYEAQRHSIQCLRCAATPRSKYFMILVDVFKAYGGRP